MNVCIQRENANDDRVVVSSVFVKNGDYVEKDDKLLEFETSKAITEVLAPCSGYISRFKARQGDLINVESQVCSITSEPYEKTDEEVTSLSSKVNSDIFENIKLSDAAKSYLVDGEAPPDGLYWVSSKDLKISGHKKSYQNTASFVSNDFGANEGHKISRRKILEIEALQKSSNHLNSTISIKLKTGVRRTANPIFDSGILDLLIYETSNLLSTDYKDLNSLYIADHRLIFREDVVAGIAMDTNDNLTVVSINQCPTLELTQQALTSAIIKFEEGKLSSRDFIDPSYTITDLSSTAADGVIPLINGNQSFILAVVFRDDDFSLFGTFDHKVTSGKRFSNFLESLRLRLASYFNEAADNASCRCYFCLKTLGEEKKAGNRGMLKIYDGINEKYICRNCFDGW